MAKIREKAESQSRVIDSATEHAGSRPYLASSYFVMLDLGLKRADLNAYIQKKINAPLHSLMHEREVSAIYAKRWVKRSICFERYAEPALCIRRMCYFPSERGNVAAGNEMRRIGITIFPLEVLTEKYEEVFERFFGINPVIKRIKSIFLKFEDTPELMGYLSRMTARRYSAENIVIVDEMHFTESDRSEEEVLEMLKAVGQKVDRKRAFVIMPGEFLPEERSRITAETGFRPLEGTEFYVSGSIQKFRELRFWVWFHKE